MRLNTYINTRHTGHSISRSHKVVHQQECTFVRSAVSCRCLFVEQCHTASTLHTAVPVACQMRMLYKMAETAFIFPFQLICVFLCLSLSLVGVLWLALEQCCCGRPTISVFSLPFFFSCGGCGVNLFEYVSGTIVMVLVPHWLLGWVRLCRCVFVCEWWLVCESVHVYLRVCAYVWCGLPDVSAGVAPGHAG